MLAVITVSKQTIILSTLIVLLIKTKETVGQGSKSYVDSVKSYTSLVDSLVSSFHNNPETRLKHTIVHYTCISQKGGSTVDLYEDTVNKLYKLFFLSTCNTPIVEKSYYFLNKKIVFASIRMNPFEQGGKGGEKFYRDNVLIKDNTSAQMKRRQKPDVDLMHGYELLKRLKT